MCLISKENIMGCGSCGKANRGSSRVAGRNPAGGNQAGKGVTANGATPQQLQQLLRAQAEREGNNNTNPVERRRIEKIRRDAIRKALGR